MIKVITHSDSYVLKCDDIHAFVDNMVTNGGFGIILIICLFLIMMLFVLKK